MRRVKQLLVLVAAALLVGCAAYLAAAYIGHGLLDILRFHEFSGGALRAAKYGLSSSPKGLQVALRLFAAAG
jgi:prolyl oligopeptidase PreP (S9A serine peptidase family)